MVTRMYGFQSHQCRNCFQQLIRATSNSGPIKPSLRYLVRAVFMQVCVSSRASWRSVMIFRAIWQEAGSGYSWPWNDTVLWPGLRSRTLQFWLDPSRCVIQIKWKFIQFSQNTTNTLLSIYKSGNMFRLIDPSSGQFTNHIEGTFSRCAQCGIPNVYKSLVGSYQTVTYTFYCHAIV